MHPDASERVWTYPIASEQVRKRPERSKKLGKLAKTSKQSRTHGENCENIAHPTVGMVIPTIRPGRAIRMLADAKALNIHRQVDVKALNIHRQVGVKPNELATRILMRLPLLLLLLFLLHVLTT